VFIFCPGIDVTSRPPGLSSRDNLRSCAIAQLRNYRREGTGSGTTLFTSFVSEVGKHPPTSRNLGNVTGDSVTEVYSACFCLRCSASIFLPCGELKSVLSKDPRSPGTIDRRRSAEPCYRVVGVPSSSRLRAVFVVVVEGKTQ